MSGGPGSGGGPQGSLHVVADLRLAVTAPDGRSAQVVVSDDGGTIRVSLARASDLRVVGASLPGSLGGLAGAAGQLVRLVRSGALPLPPWDQPVEVGVGSTVLLRRRGGRWSPAPRLAAPAAAVLAGAVVVVGLVVAVAGRARRG